ncbi:aminotransferase class I/II-fold pyridoxal phosphate-dependent enzyme [Nocardia sp. alder85J]|uniref:aminotransferase class I/II-fold pyridoxal phosphate-dependent enzyme n=1 Tax=Nocardia sp. alder85J TaxID=2862949 RepID=UPI001CD3FF55|nr:aminotransferase class I/II-fold pyridoxal phosphate-dependent enzyme [Nocardia sp. alder85J]MCX4092769.1 aminotransferase class I/II-fold pyridoxal phosphate-dependent enzyme [Nocardia sp. alder85J]
MTTELGSPETGRGTGAAAVSGVSAGFTAGLTDRTAAGIAAAVHRGIRSGALPPGSRLPTVRDVARELRVSPATVTQAWRALAATGAIVARGRAGTFVGQPPPEPPPGGRYQRLHPPSDDAFPIDLSRGVPDPALLPDLTAALRVLADDPSIDHLSATYLGEAILPELEALVRADWPWRTERFTVVDGAIDAVDRLLAAHVRFGDAVLVENPCFPPFLDLLAQIGARAVPVGMDESGLLPAELAAALAAHAPAALLLQPRAHNPTGAALTGRRARELAAILGGAAVVVIEDDHSAGIAATPLRSLGARLPRQTVHIRSYSKSHGADLRLAVAGGPAALLDPVIERRMLGPGWTSRLLQRVLVHMLTDPDACRAVTTARTVYRARGDALRKALARHGRSLPRTDGINLWLPVADENAALIALAAAGIKAAPGGPFEVTDRATAAHLRLTVAAVDDLDVDRLAAQLAAAAAATPVYRRARRA